MIDKATYYVVIALSALLAFCLATEGFLQLPTLLQWAGRFHLLILHFPIVLVLLLAALIWWKAEILQSEWIGVVAVITLATALSGLFLSAQDQDGGALLERHKWAGAVTAFLSVGIYWGSKYIFKQKLFKRIYVSIWSFCIILTGHWGGSLTHGEQFLAYPRVEKDLADLPDDPLIYAHLVEPILEKRCVSCHSETKKKGGLLLTSYTALRKGGKKGDLIDTANWHNSLLIKRLTLPLDHKEHMPPQSKPQLSEQELSILRWWVAKGATDTLALRHLPSGDSLGNLVKHIIQSSQSDRWAHLPNIKDETISRLGNHFCTIQRISANSQALSIQLFAHPDFSEKDIEKLLPLAKNAVELDLSGLPVGDAAMRTVARFKALERLEIDRTGVTDTGLAQLKDLNNLRVLKAYQTRLTDQSLPVFRQWKKLQRLYLWETGVSAEALKSLPHLIADTGIDTTAITFKAILSKPEILDPRAFFDAPFSLKVFHRIKGIDIRYTLDGSEPTAQSTLLGKDSIIFIDKPIKVKYIATKAGWESSPIDSIELWRTGPPPPVTKLVHPPNDSYKGRGVASLFDHKKAGISYNDSLWLGFREEPMILEVSWPEPKVLSQVALSVLVDVDAYIFPPTRIEVWGGLEMNKLRRIGVLQQKMPATSIPAALRFFNCEVNPAPVRYLHIKASPLPVLPAWHPGKGDKGWIFVDEVVLVPGNKGK